MDGLTLIPLKNGLYTDFRIDQIKKTIIARLQELNMMKQEYKTDAEFLTFLVNMIEYLVEKKDKINKLDLALGIVREVFGATEEDLNIVKRNIEYLHSNKMIKRVSQYKLFCASLREWFRKK